GSHFDWLWKQLSDEEQRVLAIISGLDKEDGKALTLAEIEGTYRYHHLPYEREHLQLCLKSLGEADIIEFTSDQQPESTFFSTRVRIPVGLMRMWLHKEKSFKLILASQAVSL